MKKPIYPGLVSGSVVLCMFILSQLLRHQMRITLGLPYSNTIFLFSLFPLLSGLIGVIVGIIVLPLQKPKSSVFRIVGWLILVFTLSVDIWLFYYFSGFALGILLSWPLFWASLYIPVSAIVGYFGIRLARYADMKMTNEKAAKVIKPLSVIFFHFYFYCKYRRDVHNLVCFLAMSWSVFSDILSGGAKEASLFRYIHPSQRHSAAGTLIFIPHCLAAAGIL